MTLTLNELAARIEVQVIGDGEREVRGCAPLSEAGPQDVTFLANPRYLRHLDESKAAAVLIDPKTPSPDHLVRLESDDPYFAFRNAMIEFEGFRIHPVPMDAPIQGEADDEPSDARKAPNDGGSGNARAHISARAAIHPTASIGDDVLIHPFVTVEADAVIGTGCVLYPGVSIGEGATLGESCVLYPNVTVYDQCVLGDRVTLHASTVIGQDGFGYATHDGSHQKIPQAGRVIIGDDVEMGAGCAVERAAMGETRIGAGTKFADLVSIGHGATLGEHCLLVSYVGIAGSTQIGNYVVMGGQSGVVGHLSVGDFVQLGARGLITTDTPAGAKLAGAPATDLGTARRNMVAGQGIAAFMRETRKRIAQLEAQLEAQSSQDI